MKDFQTTIVPTLSVKNGMAAIEFYKKAFGAVELMRIGGPDGLIVAELTIDNGGFLLRMSQQRIATSARKPQVALP